MKTKKLIEAKQARLNMLYLRGSITKTELRDMLRSYAQIVCRILGD